MTRVRRLVFGPILVGATVLVAPAYSAELAEPVEPAGTAAPAGAEGDTSSGRLLGVVTDAAGAPLEEVLISATGPRGATLAVCDAEGRFEFHELAPGTYLLRTHIAGFAAPERHVVQVKSDSSTVHSVTLRRATSEAPAPAFLAAGIGIVPSVFSAAGEAEAAGTQPELDRVTPDAGGVERHAVAPHDDSAKAWWLRRARRSVLKDSSVDVRAAGALDRPATPAAGFGKMLAANGGRMAEVPTPFWLSGQLHLLTRATIHSPSEVGSSDILPGQIAYVALGGPEQRSSWGLKGAVRTGDAGSFVLAGTYAAETSGRHELVVGASYSRQHLSSAALDAAALVPTAEGIALNPSREVGSVSVEGAWAIAPRLDFDYGVSVARYGYLEETQLFSPQAVFTLKPLRRTRVRLALSQYMLAPGAEEFLPPSQGVWLPPERTFAPLSAREPLKAERSRHFEAAIERDFGRTVTIGVRRFTQQVSDQMITLFGVRPHIPTSSSNHYYLTRATGVSAEGWGVMVSHQLAGRVRGTLDYSLTDAEWAPWTAGGLSPETVGVFRSGSDRFHDVTTSVETEIPETSTRVLLVYRVNTAFSNTDATGATLTSGFGGRFALRVSQTLPFSPIEGSDWEVLVDVRSLFREQVAGASVYDELLVVNPPKQVVGGLVVRF